MNRCKATKLNGKPCKQSIGLTDGYCRYHNTPKYHVIPEPYPDQESDDEYITPPTSPWWGVDPERLPSPPPFLLQAPSPLLSGILEVKGKLKKAPPHIPWRDPLVESISQAITQRKHRFEPPEIATTAIATTAAAMTVAATATNSTKIRAKIKPRIKTEPEPLQRSEKVQSSLQQLISLGILDRDFADL